MTVPERSASATDRRLTTTWLVAGVLTLASWAGAVAVDSSHTSANTAIAIVGLVLGTVKVRLIVQQFMDVRTAPRWLKTFTDVWLSVLSISLLTMFLIA